MERKPVTTFNNLIAAFIFHCWSANNHAFNSSLSISEIVKYFLTIVVDLPSLQNYHFYTASMRLSSDEL